MPGIGSKYNIKCVGNANISPPTTTHTENSNADWIRIRVREISQWRMLRCFLGGGSGCYFPISARFSYNNLHRGGKAVT